MILKFSLQFTVAALLSIQTFGANPVTADNATSSAPEPTATPAPAGQPATPPADKSKFKIILLVGQSNMAGRGPVTAADKEGDPRVLVLNKQDLWYCQGEPLHYDKPGMTGVGPGFAFAKLLAEKEPGVTVGVLPCAFGGTTLEEWDPAAKKAFYPPDNLYNNAIRRAKIAMKSGTLAGILWHQGEGNANKDAETYAARLAKLVAQFRKDLGAPDVPFIAGEIGTFIYDRNPFAKTINEQIDTLPTLVTKSAVASSDGLKDKGDRLHFDNASQKELAQRYFEAYLKVQAAGTQEH